jgi:glycosyltransferase involved in cell wall biosynthesis
MISVIIPLYNKEKQILGTLDSVFQQTYSDYEIVVVDDGSTDHSADIVASLEDKRIHLINQKNAGVSAARNRGIAEARGEFVAFLDADDGWKSDYLSTQIKLVEDYPECDVFATNYEIHNEHGKLVPTIINGLSFEGDSGILSNYFKVAAKSNPPLWTSAVMIRKSAIEAIKGFPVGVKSGEDLLTWARLACRYKIAYTINCKAIFNVECYSVTEKPKRIPPDEDYVGDELVKLKNTVTTPGLPAYISLWHKMRSSVYMRSRHRGKSIREALIGLKYNPLNYKLIAYIFINLLPTKLQPF